MSEFVQLRSPYKISDINLDRIATKEHQRSKKLIVKIYYKPNRSHHTDFLFQTPEILLKNSINYNKKGHYELIVPFLGKKHTQVEKFEEFINNLEKKVIEIIKKHKEWFPDKNIRFKSIIRYPDSKEDLYKSLRLKIDSNTLITKNGTNIDLNNLQKDFYVKCILKVSFLYIKDSFATINIYPKLIDIRDQKENLTFAPESDNDSSITSEELTTESEGENNKITSEVKTSPINNNDIKDKPNIDNDLETFKTIESSTMEIPSEIRDNCGTSNMFNEEDIKQNNDEDNNEDNNDEDNNEDNKVGRSNSPNELGTSELELNEVENILVIDDNLDTDTSIISNINNSENIIETYNNMKITNINFNSEESEDSDYSEEINQDEIKQFETELLTKS